MPPWCATAVRRTRWRRRTPRRAASSAPSAWSRSRPRDSDAVAALARDEDVLLALGTRNQRLSRFWLTDQEGAPPDPTLKGKSAVILHGEDDFVNMLRHVLGVFGMSSTVVRHEDYATGAFDGADLVIIGPGPGDPRDGEHPKIAAFRTAVDDLLATRSALPRGVPRPPDALRPPRHPARLQGHRLPGHAVADPLPRAHRAGRLLQHLRRPGERSGRPSRGRHGRAGRGDRRRPPRRRAALPRHPVPRGVDPHRARLRPHPRPRAALVGDSRQD